MKNDWFVSEMINLLNLQGLAQGFNFSQHPQQSATSLNKIINSH